MFSKTSSKGQVNGVQKGFATTSPAPSHTLSPIPLDSDTGASFLGVERLFAGKVETADYQSLS